MIKKKFNSNSNKNPKTFGIFHKLADSFQLKNRFKKDEERKKKISGMTENSLILSMKLHFILNAQNQKAF